MNAKNILHNLDLVYGSIRHKDDYLFDFTSCIQKRIRQKGNTDVSFDNFVEICNKTAEKDLKNNKKVPEVYDDCSISEIINYIPDLAQCVFRSETVEMMNFFQKKGGNLLSVD